MKIFVFFLILICTTSSFLAAEGERYLVFTGNCEGTAREQRPEGFPVMVRLNTQTGESWVLLRVHQFPYNYFWEKISDQKNPKQN